MSFSGYYQLLCKNGHELDAPCYESEEIKDIKCSCGEGIAWWNLVDVTNGSYCDCHDGCRFCDKGRIDGYVELEIMEESKEEHCLTCGHVRIVKRVRYKIPEERGVKAE